jgi:plastocyanin
MIYNPAFITVPVGSTVTFILVNGPDPDHPLGFDPPLIFSTKTSGNDVYLTYTFIKSGAYTFYCEIHGNYGTVTVK